MITNFNDKLQTSDKKKKQIVILRTKYNNKAVNKTAQQRENNFSLLAELN